MHVRLDGEFGERKRHTGEDINDNLELLAFLIFWCVRIWYMTHLLGDTGLVPAKHGIASQQTGEKAIVATLFSNGRWINIP